MNKEKNFFNENGYAIYRNIFSQKELSNYRNLIKKTLDKDLKEDRASYYEKGKKSVYYTYGDISLKPISKLLFNKKIISIVKEILGEKPSYFGEGNYQVGVGDRGYHRDSVNEIIDGKSTRIFGHGPDWNEDYKLVRVGVYLQDHDVCSGGVKFQQGSNKLYYNQGKSVLADTKAGDVAIWDLRTFHSGNSVRLKGFPNIALPRRVEDLLPSYFTIPELVIRNSVFMVFGVDNFHLHRHIEKHYKVKFKKHIEKSSYRDDIINLFNDFDINFIKVD